MKNFVVSVTKVTDEDLMREACETTFLGTSHQKLSSIYKSEHSPARTQLFWVKCQSIPLFVSTHLLRHHVGSTPYQLTCRDDREGGNPGLIGRVDTIIDQLRDLQALPSGDRDDAVDNICLKLQWLQENTDRYTPVNLGLMINAQSLIDMAKLRLCSMAHAETVQIFKEIKSQIAICDPDLATLMVRKCVYRGGICGEARCCGFNNTLAFKSELEAYASQFSAKQRGLFLQD